MNWKERLKAYPIEWLLDSSNPSVRFWTLQDLLDMTIKDSEVQKTREAIMTSIPVKSILEAQNPEGFWVNSENMYLPKYKATTHSLLILAELGATRTQLIENGIEHIFQFQRDSGHFLTEKPKTSRGKASKVTDGCCLDANILYYLNHFGYIDDPRTKKTIDFLLEDHDYVNSGWRCRAYPIDPNRVFPVNCYMGAAKVLKAFASISKEQRSENMETVLEKIVENVLENRIYQYLKTTEGSRKDKAGWKRFGFPLFYQSDVLEILDAITKLGIKDSRMDHAIKLIFDSQQEGGSWLLKHTFNGKMWIDIEEKHKPSKWNTLKALRILKRYYNN